MTSQSCSGAVLLKVAIPGPFKTALTYSAPNLIAAGCRVEVPLSQRLLVGVVTGVAYSSEIHPEKIKPIRRQLDAEPLITEALLQLAAWMSRYYLHDYSSPYLLALPTLLRKAEAAQFPVQSRLSLTTAGSCLEPGQLYRAPKQQALLARLQRHGEATLSELRREGFSSQTFNGLVNKQLCVIAQHQLRGACPPTGELLEPPLPLTSEQRSALVQLDMHSFAAYLLDGVTGSGKTEVYLHAIARCLENGRRVLVLVPEISLTPQTVSRFKRRFSDRVVALHSGMSEKQRKEAWLLAQMGQAAVVIGTRSAILTPLPALGMIIVDEEHDASFKQQDGLRYQARDVALKRAQDANIPIVLGTATPSLESLHNAQSGRYRLLRLSLRPQAQQLPTIATVDMRQEAQQTGLSLRLLAAMRQHLQANRQVLLFLNRRGYAPSWFCEQCGWLADCTYCDAHLTYHRAQHMNICHHCGHQQLPQQQCPQCGYRPLQPLGTGTERAEEVVQQHFPQVPIIRFDRDVVTTPQALDQQLAKVQQAGPAILLGTQMLAKGHHFDRISLVGIWDIDIGLFSADLRAKERMGQLLVQVAGRCGRSRQGGEVLVQSYYADNPIFKPLLTHDYHQFAARLLAERRAQRLPPYGFIAILRADSAFAERAEQLLQQLGDLLTDSPELKILGPMPSLLSRRAGKYRFMLILQAKKRSALHQALQPLYHQQPRRQRQVDWHIDIDPAELA